MLANKNSTKGPGPIQGGYMITVAALDAAD
jgi:hypothetical protein